MSSSEEPMDDKEFHTDFFAPIVTIDESFSAVNSKSQRSKKNKIKDVRKEKHTEVSNTIIKRKRGRPKKVDNASQKDSKKKYSNLTDEHNLNANLKDLHTENNPVEPLEHLIVKSELIDENELMEIKLEIKDEPQDDLPNIALEENEGILGKSKVLKCPLCVKEKDDDAKYSPDRLREHYREIHPGKRLRQTKQMSSESFPCDVCGKEFRTTSAVKDHLETHSNYYFCEFCNASQKRLLDYIIHKRAHSEEGKFECAMCDFFTEDINAITEHVNNHDEVLRYWCAQCKKGFAILAWFKEHDNFHTGLKPFCCEFCEKCFLYSRYLHAHKVNFHNHEVKFPTLHECVICHKQYQHKNSLKLHMNSHTGNYSICDICGKMLSSKEKLKFHMRIHTGYKPYSCTYCDKSFTKKPILVEHTRVHTGERPYICEYCHKAFSQRSSLVIHIRGHTGEKPYVCQFCSKGFVAKAMLNVHLKTCKGLFVAPQIGILE